MDALHQPPDIPPIDEAAIEAFVNVVFAGLSGHVPIRLLAETGTPDQHPVSSFAPVAETAASLNGLAPQAARDARAVYVVPGTVAKPGSAKADDIAETRVILVDLDAGDIEAKRAHLIQHLGQPSLEVASGGRTASGATKLHLYWRLSSIAHGADLERTRALREAIAVKVGADPAFKSLHQPIRVPGTIHGKNGVRSPVRMIAVPGVEYGLDELIAAVDRMPPIAAAVPLIGAGAPRQKRPAVRELANRPVWAGNLDEISRFEAISRMIGHWLRNARVGNCTLAEAWEAMQDYNAAMIRPPWPEARLRHEFDALLKRDRATHAWKIEGAGAPKHEGSDNAAGSAPPFSDDALAAAFVTAHGSDWRYIAAWGAWHRWTGSHWANDDCRLVRELVRQVCRAAAKEASKPYEAQRVASAKTIASVERIACADPVVATRSEDWDSHPMLLNTPAGVIDLATGEVTAHDPALLITQITTASPGRSCPRFLKFLDEITAGDHSLRDYLQRLAGYCLTGVTSEQMLAFLHGDGSNGKSVFMRTVASVLGSYAATATLDTFVQTRAQRHLTELAGLRAARLVLVTETELGASWAEARIKSVTGGEKIRANFMRQDHFEFRPRFKLLVAGNHRPRLTSVGEAMRRRLHLVPFTVTFGPDQRDRNLDAHLLAERDGILGWMLDGCTEWLKSGLAPPPSVKDAVTEYIEAEDLVGQWLDETCVVGPERRATAKALYASWTAWAAAMGETPGSQKALGEALRGRGFQARKVNGQRGWVGLAPRRFGPDGEDGP